MRCSWAVLMLTLFALPTQAAVEMYYIHNDHLGTPRVITNQAQQVVWRGQLKPFGETMVEVEAITNHRRFPGQRFDIESRLHYNYFRDYDPRTGRYMQSDPIGLGGGLNTYAYVGGNPVNWVDPLGLEVRVVTSDPVAAKILMDAYARLNRTKKGMEICETLEKSPDLFEIRPINQDAFYCPPGATDPKCQGKTRTTFVDPYNNIELPTTNGMQPASKPVVLGHELGHATGTSDDGPGQMNNVNANENPIRQAFGLPARTSYTVPQINWVPGTK
jgi:RHS repeat-associated protein